MKKFTIELKVEGPNSGCVKDWLIRQLMDEVGYAEMTAFNIYNEDGEDVTNEIDTDIDFCLKGEWTV